MTDYEYTFTVEVMRSRTVELGAWCERCLRPSVARVEIMLRTSEDGRPYYHVARICASCARGDGDA